MVPAIYLIIISVIFFRWAADEERRDRDRPTPGSQVKGPVA